MCVFIIALGEDTRQTDSKCFSKGLEHLEQAEIIDFASSWLMFFIAHALMIDIIE